MCSYILVKVFEGALVVLDILPKSSDIELKYERHTQSFRASLLPLEEYKMMKTGALRIKYQLVKSPQLE